jgi:hypothetical protein
MLTWVAMLRLNTNEIEAESEMKFMGTAVLGYTCLNCSAFTVKVEHNCHFPASSWNFRQALQGFSDTSPVSLHKNNKINLPTL